MAGIVLMGFGMTRRMIRGTRRLRGGNEKQRRRHHDYRPPHGKDAQFAVKSARICRAFIDGKVVYYHIMVDDGEYGWEVQRRFADFADARDGMLINTDPNELNLNPSFPFPSKDMNNKNFHMSIPNQEKMEQRRLALEKWLNERIEMVRRKYDDPEWMEMNNLRHALYRMEAELAWLLGVDSVSSNRIPVRRGVHL